MDKNISSENPQELQSRKVCGFCESEKNISKEHFWPQWFKAEGIGDSENNTNTQSRYLIHGITKGDIKINGPFSKTRQGLPRTRQIRHFCESCNNGWMSIIQNNAKELLKKLIQDKNFEIGSNDLNILLPWIVMTTMTAEYTDPDVMGITQEQRAHFMKDFSMLGDWYIWLGRYTGKNWQTRYHHKGFKSYPLSIFDKIIKEQNLPKTYNIQESIFVVGNLIIYVISGATGKDLFTPKEEFIFNFSIDTGLRPIFPTDYGSFNWRSLPVTSDIGLDDLTTFLVTVLNPQNHFPEHYSDKNL